MPSALGLHFDMILAGADNGVGDVLGGRRDDNHSGTVGKRNIVRRGRLRVLRGVEEEHWDILGAKAVRQCLVIPGRIR